MILQFFRRSRYEPVEHITLVGLLSYGSRPADFSAATITTLRLNANKLSEADLAQAMGWSVARLRQVCKSARPPIVLGDPASRENEPRGA